MPLKARGMWHARRLHRGEGRRRQVEGILERSVSDLRAPGEADHRSRGGASGSDDAAVSFHCKARRAKQLQRAFCFGRSAGGLRMKNALTKAIRASITSMIEGKPAAARLRHRLSLMSTRIVRADGESTTASILNKLYYEIV